MEFKEPKVEFVPIDLSITATGSGEGGYETCTGPTAPSNKCPTYAVNYYTETGDDYWVD